MKNFLLKICVTLILLTSYAFPNSNWDVGQVLQISGGTLTIQSSLGGGFFKTVWKAELAHDDGKKESVAVLEVDKRIFKLADPQRSFKYIYRANKKVIEIANRGDNRKFFVLKSVHVKVPTSSNERPILFMVSELANGDASELLKAMLPLRYDSSQEVAQKLDQILAFGVDISKSVQALNDAGYIHGDLKPENFLIMDRGLTLSDLDGMVTIGDKPNTYNRAYTAPEVLIKALGEKSAQMTDQFGVGSILYQILTDKVPVMYYMDFVQSLRKTLDQKDPFLKTLRRNILSVEFIYEFSLKYPDHPYSFKRVMETKFSQIEGNFRRQFKNSAEWPEIENKIKLLKNQILPRLEVNPAQRTAGLIEIPASIETAVNKNTIQQGTRRICTLAATR